MQLFEKMHFAFINLEKKLEMYFYFISIKRTQRSKKTSKVKRSDQNKALLLNPSFYLILFILHGYI